MRKSLASSKESFYFSFNVSESEYSWKPSKGQKVIVTGGASSNKQILQVIADIFQLDVYVNQSTANSAAMGAAYRAFYSLAWKADKKKRLKLNFFETLKIE